jgi:1,4-dihydroxy-2-naphthoyl-CoA hydrolase
MPGQEDETPTPDAAAPAPSPSPSPSALSDLMPFAKTLGVVFDVAGKDEVRAHLAWAPELCTSGGLLHGGVLMSLADSTGAACAFLNLPEGAGTTTIESKTNFLRGVREGEGGVVATSRPLHVGRKVMVVETDLRDDRKRLVARVTQTQMVLEG